MTEADLQGDLPPGWVRATLGAFTGSRGRSVNPAAAPNNHFELYSVPSHAIGMPEIVAGNEIGSSKQIVDQNTVLLCKINPRINRVWVVGNYSNYLKIASTEWIPFPYVDGVEPKYLAYYMRQTEFVNFLASNVSGVGGSLMRVNARTITDYPFPLAPLAEQQRIVEAIEAQFTRLDAGVAALKRLRANLKRYKAAVLKAACEGRLVEQDPGDEPASELLTRILKERRAKWAADQRAKGKDPHKLTYKEPAAPDTADLPDLPEGWVWASLDQVFHVERGRFSVRPRNDPKYYGGEYPFVQIGDLPRDGGNIISYSQTLNQDGLKISKLFRTGTTLIAIVGATIANTGILMFDSCAPDSLVALQSPNEFFTRYAELYLRFQKHYIRDLAYASGGQPNINLGILKPYPLPLPPNQEQNRIIEETDRLFTIFDEVQNAIETNLHRAERLRQSILREAFTGRLVPQDPNDEPAGELFKRIRRDRARQTNGKKRR